MIPMPSTTPTQCYVTCTLVASQTGIARLFVAFGWRREGQAVQIVGLRRLKRRLCCCSPRRACCLSSFLCILHPDVLVQAVQLLRLAPSDTHGTPFDDHLSFQGFCRRLRIFPLYVVDVCAMGSVRAYQRSQLAVLCEMGAKIVLREVVL